MSGDICPPIESPVWTANRVTRGDYRPSIEHNDKSHVWATNMMTMEFNRSPIDNCKSLVSTANKVTINASQPSMKDSGKLDHATAVKHEVEMVPHQHQWKNSCSELLTRQVTRPAASTSQAQLSTKDQAIQTALRQSEEPESLSTVFVAEKVLPSKSFVALAEAQETEELSKASRSSIQPSLSTFRVNSVSLSMRGTAASRLRPKLKALSQKYEEFEEMKPHTLQCAVQSTSNGDESQEKSNPEQGLANLEWSTDIRNVTLLGSSSNNESLRSQCKLASDRQSNAKEVLMSRPVSQLRSSQSVSKGYQFDCSYPVMCTRGNCARCRFPGICRLDYPMKSLLVPESSLYWSQGK